MVRSPLRVLHVVGGMDQGGAEALIINLYRHIDRTRIHFDFAVNTTKACHYDNEVLNLGGRIFRHEQPETAGLVAFNRAFWSTLRHYGPFAAVHSHVRNFSGVVLCIAHRAGTPCRIAHAHSIRDEHPATMRRAVYRWVTKRLIHRYATHMLGCSRDVCEGLFGPDCWRDERVRVFPNAIQVTLYQNSQLRHQVRHALGLSGNPLIGHVGSFRDAKNHKFLIDVFALLLQQLPEAHLILVGDGPLRPHIERQVEQCGIGTHVHFLGTRTDVPPLLACMDLLVFPSLHEGLPTVLIEAQAAGVPCVVSDTVTKEADLHLGLLTYLNLFMPLTVWTNTCLQSLRMKRPDAHSRLSALRAGHYDIQDAVHPLEAIYSRALSHDNSSAV